MSFRQMLLCSLMCGITSGTATFGVLASMDRSAFEAVQNAPEQIIETIQPGPPSFASKLDQLKVVAAQLNRTGQVAAKASKMTAPPAGMAPAEMPRGSEAPDVIAAFQSVENSAWVPYGKGSRPLYVFYDFKCGGCRQARPHLLEMANDPAEDVELRFIPLSVIGPESLALAAAVLEPQDVSARQAALEKALASTLRISPAKTKGEPTPGEVRAIQNLEVMLSSPRQGTPTLALMTENGPMFIQPRSSAEIRQAAQRIKAE